MYLRGSILRYKGYYYAQDENGKTIDLGDIESINLSREEIIDSISEEYNFTVNVLLVPNLLTNYQIDDEIVKRDFKVLNSWSESMVFTKKEDK